MKKILAIISILILCCTIATVLVACNQVSNVDRSKIDVVTVDKDGKAYRREINVLVEIPEDTLDVKMLLPLTEENSTWSVFKYLDYDEGHGCATICFSMFDIASYSINDLKAALPDLDIQSIEILRKDTDVTDEYSDYLTKRTDYTNQIIAYRSDLENPLLSYDDRLNLIDKLAEAEGNLETLQTIDGRFFEESQSLVTIKIQETAISSTVLRLGIISMAITFVFQVAPAIVILAIFYTKQKRRADRLQLGLKEQNEQ